MDLPTFLLERYFARYEFQAEYLLGSSDCESWQIADLLDLEPGAQQRFASHWLGYTETPGSVTLRTEICNLYDSLAPESILVHSGADEAIFLFMHAVLQSGDHAVVHWPCYQSLFDAARATGAEVTPWKARAANRWALDIDELRSLLRRNTRVVVINVPHNPTGYLMPSDEYRTLHEIVRDHGALLFSDEVYRETEHDVTDRLKAACDMGEHAVSLGAMSKGYGLPGLRIGWIATQDRNIAQRMLELKDFTTICNSAPSEFLAEVGLRHRHTLLDRNLSIIGRNLDVLDVFFEDYRDRFAWRRPTAGSVAFPLLREGNADAFCADLVQRANVMLVPGSLFGDEQGHFRIGFGRKNLPEAIARVRAYLSR